MSGSDGEAGAPRYRRLTQDRRRAAIEEAALACIARGGIAAFTIERVAAEAGVSGGLVVHHFRSKEGLLAACYARIYNQMTEVLERPHPGIPRLRHIVEVLTSPEFFSREALNIWVALWGEIPNNPELLAEHRARLGAYRADIVAAVAEIAGDADAESIALGFISLVDGLGLQHRIDPELMPAETARRTCWRYLEAELGRPVGPAGDPPPAA